MISFIAPWCRYVTYSLVYMLVNRVQGRILGRSGPSSDRLIARRLEAPLTRYVLNPIYSGQVNEIHIIAYLCS